MQNGHCLQYGRSQMSWKTFSVRLSHNILILAHHIPTFCLMFCLYPNGPLHLWLKHCHTNSGLKLQEITGNWFGPLAESHIPIFDHQLNTKPHTALHYDSMLWCVICSSCVLQQAVGTFNPFLPDTNIPCTTGWDAKDHDTMSISANLILRTVWESMFRLHGSWYEEYHKVSYPKVADDNAAGYTVDSQELLYSGSHRCCPLSTVFICTLVCNCK